jgi:hypothetical protein
MIQKHHIQREEAKHQTIQNPKPKLSFSFIE